MGKAIEITRLDRSAAGLRTLAVKTEDSNVVRLLGIALLLDGWPRHAAATVWWHGPADAVQLGASLQHVWCCQSCMLAWAYRVEAVDQDGRSRLIDTWPTEEAALSRLRDLQARAEAAQREMGPGVQDWRG